MFTFNPNSFAKKLTADSELKNNRRQVKNASFSYVKPSVPLQPKKIHIATELAEKLNFTKEFLQSDTFLQYFSGSKNIPNFNPYAMNYGGHQFGHWANQLGDGRAITIADILVQNQAFSLQLKGSGETPYSRSADGNAVLRSSIREYLGAEAMHFLGVPSTRSLSLIESGNWVERDMLYNGNPKNEKGAIVCRVSPSFVRFGNFEIHAARKEHDILQQLLDFTIDEFYPDVTAKGTEKYIQFFEKVMQKTLSMIIHWQRVGFVHGVMNTDNMSILGLTIDYGPFSFLDEFYPQFTPNTTDNLHKRYRFDNQPYIAQWNLLQLANALYPIIKETKPLEAILNQYSTEYHHQYKTMMCEKIGLFHTDFIDDELITSLTRNLQTSETDYTLFFRRLAYVDKPESALQTLGNVFYSDVHSSSKKWQNWFEKYFKYLEKETYSQQERSAKMNANNPAFIIRNYMYYLAIEAAENNDYSLIDEFYTLLKNPYDESELNQKWRCKKPDWAENKVGCSALSCSS